MSTPTLRRRIGGSLAVALFAVAIAGSGLVAAADPSASPVAPAQPSPAAEGVTAAAAIDIALGNVPGGAVVDLDQGWERGVPVWDIVVLGADGVAVELYIDAIGGSVIDQEPARVPLLAAGGAPAITAQQAIGTALGEVPGGTVLEADLDLEDGRLVWDVVVRIEGGRLSVYVDAASGEVVKVEDA
jgi:uncharacterized membrane protein YkoI